MFLLNEYKIGMVLNVFYYLSILHKVDQKMECCLVIVSQKYN